MAIVHEKKDGSVIVCASVGKVRAALLEKFPECKSGKGNDEIIVPDFMERSIYACIDRYHCDVAKVGGKIRVRAKAYERIFRIIPRSVTYM